MMENEYIVKATELISLFSKDKKKYEAYPFVDLFYADLLKNPLPLEMDERFLCIIQLYDLENHQYLKYFVPVNDKEDFPDVSNFWPVASWHQRELEDLMGVSHSGENKKKLFVSPFESFYPLRKDHIIKDKLYAEQVGEVLSLSRGELKGDQAFSEISPLPSMEQKISREEVEFHRWVRVGPYNKADQGSFSLFCKMDDDVIIDSKIEMGDNFKAVEALLENKNYCQIIPYCGRLNFQSSEVNIINYCMAIEKALEVDIPERAQALRMVLLEICRINEHLNYHINLCRLFGPDHIRALLYRRRNEIFELINDWGGSRIHPTLNRIGGISRDILPDWGTRALELVNNIVVDMDAVKKEISRSSQWMDSLKLKIVGAKEAVNWGITGPVLRSTGVKFDKRKEAPFYFYGDLDFEVPLGVFGECFDLYLVRMEEIRQSAKIISQLLEYLPLGGISSTDPQVDFYFRKSEIPKDQYIEKVKNGIKIPPQVLYHSLESPNGELGVHIIGNGSKFPERIKFRSPSLPLVPFFEKKIIGHNLLESQILYTSLNIVPSEVER
jgi:NADH-quinone oxidoreductase subunit C/D